MVKVHEFLVFMYKSQFLLKFSKMLRHHTTVQLSSGLKKLKFTSGAWLGLGGSKPFKLYPIRSIWIKLDLIVKFLSYLSLVFHFCPTLTNVH